MDEQKIKEVEIALADFIIRVAKGKTTSETEVQVLPEVAAVLKDYFYLGSVRTMSLSELKKIEKEYNKNFIGSNYNLQPEDLPKHPMELL